MRRPPGSLAILKVQINKFIALNILAVKFSQIMIWKY